MFASTCVFTDFSLPPAGDTITIVHKLLVEGSWAPGSTDYCIVTS